jgi:hypothetical protein
MNIPIQQIPKTLYTNTLLDENINIGVIFLNTLVIQGA